MLGQAALPTEEASPSLQVSTDQTAVSQDAASKRNRRLLWTGLGFAVLMLVSVSAHSHVPLAAHASAKPSHLVSGSALDPSLSALRSGGPPHQTVAFTPSLPARRSLGHNRPSVTGARPAVRAGPKHVLPRMSGEGQIHQHKVVPGSKIEPTVMSRVGDVDSGQGKLHEHERGPTAAATCTPRQDCPKEKVKFYNFIRQASEGWQWQKDGSAGVLASVAASAMPIIAAGVLTSFSGAALAAEVGKGEKLFSNNCLACHVGGQNVIQPEQNLWKGALEKYLDGGMNEAAVMKQVKNGKNAMPSFGKILTEEEIAEVATYVITTAESGWGRWDTGPAGFYGAGEITPLSEAAK